MITGGAGSTGTTVTDCTGSSIGSSTGSTTCSSSSSSSSDLF